MKRGLGQEDVLDHQVFELGEGFPLVLSVRYLGDGYRHQLFSSQTIRVLR